MMEKPRNDFSIERALRERDMMMVIMFTNAFSADSKLIRTKRSFNDDENAAAVDYDGNFIEDLDSLSMATTNI